MKILITSIGKRVQLIRYFKKSCTVVGVDCNELIASLNFVDKFYKVHKCYEKEYINELISICKKENIDILIPLYEKEFLILNKNRYKFDKIDTIIMLSNKEVIQKCNDKWNTYQFFKKNNINTPKTYLKTQTEKINKFPLIIKPRDGMGSVGVFKATNKCELDFFKKYVENPVIQEFVEGKEYTIDVLCDLNSEIISVVPRERIEVRSGEVVKSRTIMNSNIIDATINLCEKLKAVGPLTIQCIETNEKEIKFIEINPRFGGGVPLTFEAGVDYGKYFKMMKEQKHIKPIVKEFKELTMIRYDEAVFKYD